MELTRSLKMWVNKNAMLKFAHQEAFHHGSIMENKSATKILIYLKTCHIDVSQTQSKTKIEASSYL